MKTILKNNDHNIVIRNRFKLVMVVLLATSIVFSCKSVDSGEEASPVGTTTVKINISEMSFEDVRSINNGGNKASADAGGRGSVEEVQRSTVSLNSDFDLVAELTAETSEGKKNGSAMNKASGNVGTTLKDVMRSGVKYKIVVFDTNGNYIVEQDYIRGQEDAVSDFALNGDQTYQFVAYSVNSTSLLPSIIFENNNAKSANTASLSIDGNMDFSYGQQMKTLASGQNNPVNVILKHKLSQITTTVDASSSGYNISAIRAGIDSHHPKATVSLANGNITQTGTKGNIDVNFQNLNALTIVSTPTLINASTNNASFKIQSITIGSVVATNIIGFKDFKVEPGVKYNMKVNIVPKDNYLTHQGMPAVRINGQIWMQHNLGADLTLNPDQSPGVSGLFGSFYQWGGNKIVAGRADLKVNGNWRNSGPLANNTWNSGTEAVPVKTLADPCPTGFRIPTKTDYQTLIDNTIASNIGTWSATIDDVNNMTAAKVLTSKIKNGIKIIFPAQGIFNTRDDYDPPYNTVGLQYRGRFPIYHSSTSEHIHKMSEFEATETFAHIVTRADRQAYKFRALPIRCIAL